MSSIRKAIAALITSLFTLGALFGLEVPQALTGPDYLAAISTLLAPFLVWLVPNRS
jgi:hypothetical protein